jgi:hypothetical protein
MGPEEGAGARLYGGDSCGTAGEFAFQFDVSLPFSGKRPLDVRPFATSTELPRGLYP